MNERDMQHGEDWRGQDLAGWLLTEKFNGCRAYWDGKQMWTRGGIAVALPEEWALQLPAGFALDGELYHGVDGVSRCGQALVRGRFLPGMKFVVFDAPRAAGAYAQRLAAANITLRHSTLAHIVSVAKCTGNDMAVRMMLQVQERGGEGLMARHPDIAYRSGRTFLMLKLKEVIEQFDGVAA
jgi:DNA ligase-1